jgi:hypothetical protein
MSIIISTSVALISTSLLFNFSAVTMVVFPTRHTYPSIPVRRLCWQKLKNIESAIGGCDYEPGKWTFEA